MMNKLLFVIRMICLILSVISIAMSDMEHAIYFMCAAIYFCQLENDRFHDSL